MLSVLLSTWALLGLLLGASAQAAPGTDIASLDLTALPTCGFTCITTVVAASPCDLTDFDCICSNATLAEEIQSCFQAQCPVRDALKSARFSADMCHLEPHDRSLAGWLTPVVCVSVGAVSYILRLASRRYVVGSIDTSDALLGLCVLLTAPFIYSGFKMKELGWGQDMWNIPADNITEILLFFWINELLYLLVLPLSRIALLLFYLRIFTGPSTQRVIYILIGLNAAYGIGFELAAVFQCTPVEGAWHFWDAQFPTKCGDMHLLAWLAAAFNIALDVAVLALPILGLFGLRMSWRKKLQIMAMFSVGFFITVVSILRLKSLVVFAESINLTYDYVEAACFSEIEACISITCVCLPAVRALFSKLFPALFLSSHRSQRPQDVEPGHGGGRDNRAGAPKAASLLGVSHRGNGATNSRSQSRSGKSWSRNDDLHSASKVELLDLEVLTPVPSVQSRHTRRGEEEEEEEEEEEAQTKFEGGWVEPPPPNQIAASSNRRPPVDGSLGRRTPADQIGNAL